MELIQVEQEVTRKEALYYVEEVLFRFNNMLYELQENPSKKVGNPLGMIADEIINRGFTEAVRNFVSSTDILDTLSTEGYTEFLKKCGKLSEKYHLEVRIPEDVVILGEDVAKNMNILNQPDGKLYLDVVVSKGDSVFTKVEWDDVEERFIKYVESLDSTELKKMKKNYSLIFDGNTLNKTKLDKIYFNAFKEKSATQKGFNSLNDIQTKFFNDEIYNKFNVNKYYTGQGFTATIDEGVFGTGEMVLEATGKDTLPLATDNYFTYRYTVDKDCNFKFYKAYLEVK